MAMLTPRVSVEKHRRSLSFLFSPLLITIGLSPKNVSYSQLPHQPLNLSVLKLNGSCFDIEVTTAATVAELKRAVERAFSHMPKKGPGKISWSHLWGHFCLCYSGQKLLVDTDYIRDFGIKDGDQLYFIRHVSISYNLIRKRSKKSCTSKQDKRSKSQSNSIEEKEEDDSEDYDCEDIESGRLQHHDSGCGGFIRTRRSKFILFLGRRFSPPRLPTVRKLSIKRLPHPPRTPPGFLLGIRNIIQFCRENHIDRIRRLYSRRNACITTI